MSPRDMLILGFFLVASLRCLQMSIAFWRDDDEE